MLFKSEYEEMIANLEAKCKALEEIAAIRRNQCVQAHVREAEMVEKCSRLATELESAEAGRQYWIREALQRGDGEDSSHEVRRLAAEVHRLRDEVADWRKADKVLREHGVEVYQDIERGPGHVAVVFAEQARLAAQVERMTKTEENHDKLRAFVDWMLAYMQDGGDMDGGTFQGKAQEHGILVETRPKEPCGEGCHCAEYYSTEEFTQGEARCFVRSTVVGGKEPPTPANCPTCHGGGLALAHDQGAGCPGCGKEG